MTDLVTEIKDDAHKALTSIEKLPKVLADLQAAKPTSQLEEALTQFLPMVLPLVAQLLPNDPSELDEQLISAAMTILQAVSDPGSHETAPTAAPVLVVKQP